MKENTVNYRPIHPCCICGERWLKGHPCQCDPEFCDTDDCTHESKPATSSRPPK